MKKLLLLSLFLLASGNFLSYGGNPLPVKKTASPLDYSLTVFDQVLFFDGYAATVTLPLPPPGVIRHRNDLYARKLTQDQLLSFGSDLTMNITVKASCDNYDRIGNVNLAFVPKNQSTYSPDQVSRIEIGRFITPFMNKNVSPNEVPYSFEIDNVANIFKDVSITANYDIWVELQIFGVPYAANTQIAGCAGRNDVFFGTLEFVSFSPATAPTATNYIKPLSFQHYLNNYDAAATDILGQTIKTISFDLPLPVADAKFYLITSNHGSNSGGEEYNRRFHYIYLDNVQKLMYKPGSLTCEPFRDYNTQGNGIYGASPMTNAQWQSFSNWCPGDVIPIRVIDLGDLAAGTHTFQIKVPTAQFVGGQGYIPVSVYLQGTGSGSLLGTDEVAQSNFGFYPNPATDMVTINTQDAIETVRLFNLLGQEIMAGHSNTVNLSGISKGVYLLQVTFANHQVASQKLIKQ